MTSMNTPTTEFRWQSTVSIILILLSILPIWLLIETWAEGRQRAREAALRRAREANETAIALLRNPESTSIALDDCCEAFSRRLARATPCPMDVGRFADPAIDAIAKKRAIPAFRELRRNGVKPLAVLWMGMHVGSDPSFILQEVPRFSVIAGSGFSSHHQRRDLIEMLEILTSYAFTANKMLNLPPLERKLSSILGIRQTIPSIASELRGRCGAISWQGKPAWMFWQVLRPRDITARVKDINPEIQFAPGGSQYSWEAKKMTTLGGVLLILPREDTGQLEPARRLRLLEPGLDRATSLGLIDPASRRLWRSPRLAALRDRKDFTAASIFAQVNGTPPSTSAPLSGRPDEPLGEWIMATASFVLDRPMIGLAKTRVVGADSEPLPWFLAMGWQRFCLVLVTATIWGAGWWMIREFVLAGLRWQLGLGFALAAVLPLSLLFSVSQRLADEHLEDEITQTRNKLRRDLVDIEQRHLLHRSWYFRIIRSINADKRFAALLSQPVRDRKALQKIVDEWYLRIWGNPLDLSIRFLTLVGPNRFSVQHKKDGPGDSDMLGVMLEYIAEKALAQLNPPDPNHTAEPPLDRRELAADLARNGLANAFGPEIYYGIHHLTDEPMVITAGYGTLIIHAGFIPRQLFPKGAMISFLGGKHSDVQAMRRILHGQGGTPRLVAQPRDMLGFDQIPEEAANFPFIRQLTRRLATMQVPFSLQLERLGRKWLIEGRPSQLSKQFLYLGMEPLDPLFDKAAATRRNLFFRLVLTVFGLFILAWAATRDLLVPLRQLTIGMQAIEAGDFSWRSDIRRGDELEQLGEAFNQMAHGLEEGRVMGRMVSATARAAMSSAADEALAQDGSRRAATILFLQFNGISDALATHDSAEILASLSRSTARVGRIVEAGGGDLDKLLGEKILAVFFHDRQPAREATIAAIKAALTLTLDQRSETRGPGDETLVFPLVAGISTGVVISGLLGAGSRRDFTIIGDPVNTAARCTSLASKLPARQTRVVVTEAAWDSAIPVFKGASLPPVTLKGKTTPITLYQITDWNRD